MSNRSSEHMEIIHSPESSEEETHGESLLQPASAPSSSLGKLVDTVDWERGQGYLSPEQQRHPMLFRYTTPEANESGQYFVILS